MGGDGPLQNWGKNFTNNSKMAIIIDRINLWEQWFVCLFCCKCKRRLVLNMQSRKKRQQQ